MSRQRPLHCSAGGVWKMSACPSIHLARGHTALVFNCGSSMMIDRDESRMAALRDDHLSAETAPFRPSQQSATVPTSPPPCTLGTARLGQITMTSKAHSGHLSISRLIMRLHKSYYRRPRNYKPRCNMSVPTHWQNSWLLRYVGKCSIPTFASCSQVRSPPHWDDTGGAAGCTDRQSRSCDKTNAKGVIYWNYEVWPPGGALR